eukprot:300742_1
MMSHAYHTKPMIVYDERKLYNLAFNEAKAPFNKKIVSIIFEYVAELYIGYCQEAYADGYLWFCAYIIIPKYHQWSVIHKCTGDYNQIPVKWSRKIHRILKDKTLKYRDRRNVIQPRHPAVDCDTGNYVPHYATYYCKSSKSEPYSYLQKHTSFNLKNGRTIGWDYGNYALDSETGHTIDGPRNGLKLDTVKNHILNTIKTAKTYQHKFNGKCAWCNKHKFKVQFKLCSKCNGVYYCSKHCQKKSWKRIHRYQCVELPRKLFD